MFFNVFFFFLLLHEKKKLALLVLFTAFLTRENTMILCLITAGLGWVRNEKLLSVGGAGVLIAGMLTTGFFAKMGQPNPHHLPDLLYLLGKVPYYFLLNFLGIRIWSDVRPDLGIPFVTWHLPGWLKIGTDQVVGLVRPDWHFPVFTLVICLTLFGIGPLLLFRAIRKSEKFAMLPFAIHLALVYGIFSFAIGPLLGDWVVRLVGYSWPAFWIALPVLFFKFEIKPKTSTAFFLVAAFWITSWWPNYCKYDINCSANPWPALAVLIIYPVMLIYYRNKDRQGTLTKAAI
jgi:hypothetical protein